MSQLHDMKLRIEERIKTDGLDFAAMMGKIGLRSGRLLAFIKPDTPDTPEEVSKLKLAAKEVLNLSF